MIATLAIIGALALCLIAIVVIDYRRLIRVSVARPRPATMDSPVTVAMRSMERERAS